MKHSTTRSAGTSGMLMLTFSDSPDFNGLKLRPAKLLYMYACTFSLKCSPCTPIFLFRETLLVKVPQCSPYLLQEINPSFSWPLTWLCLLSWHPQGGEPSVLVYSITMLSASVGFQNNEIEYKEWMTEWMNGWMSKWITWACEMVRFLPYG